MFLKYSATKSVHTLVTAIYVLIALVSTILFLIPIGEKYGDNWSVFLIIIFSLLLTLLVMQTPIHKEATKSTVFKTIFAVLAIGGINTFADITTQHLIADGVKMNFSLDSADTTRGILATMSLLLVLITFASYWIREKELNGEIEDKKLSEKSQYSHYFKRIEWLIENRDKWEGIVSSNYTLGSLQDVRWILEADQLTTENMSKYRPWFNVLIMHDDVFKQWCKSICYAKEHINNKPVVKAFQSNGKWVNVPEHLALTPIKDKE